MLHALCSDSDFGIRAPHGYALSSPPRPRAETPSTEGRGGPAPPPCRNTEHGGQGGKGVKLEDAPQYLFVVFLVLVGASSSSDRAASADAWLEAGPTSWLGAGPTSWLKAYYAGSYGQLPIRCKMSPSRRTSDEFGTVISIPLLTSVTLRIQWSWVHVHRSVLISIAVSHVPSCL